MTDAPVRRGRPPRSAEIDTAPRSSSATGEADAVDGPKGLTRRPRRSEVNGGGLKLHAPTKEGMRRRWVNDKGNRIAELEALGYTKVTDPGVATHGPGATVNRLAGTHEGGAPLKTYLMETPEVFYQQGVAEKEEERSEIDQAINEGRDFTGETDARMSYRPEQSRYSSITVERE